MTRQRVALGIGAVWCFTLALGSPLPAAEDAGGTKAAAAPAPAGATKAARAPHRFLCIEHDAAGKPLALQTAIVQFQATKPQQAGLTVDLIGAVHVGEKAYYESLNAAFEKYDVVLYELVAPAGTRVPKGAKAAAHPVSVLQNGIRDLLALEHQLEYIDYTKTNLVHADMSPDGFAKSMQDRGESVWQFMFRALGVALAKQAHAPVNDSSSELDLLLALFDKDRAVSLKRILAEQFADMESLMTALEGPNGSTLIAGRNKVALAEMSRQIDAGKKRIAIFYGAAHLADMERHLVADFGLKRGGERWLTAWDLTGSK